MRDVGQRGALQNFRGGVADIKKYLVKGAVVGVAVNQRTQLLGIPEWR
jgi:hypothetical protein